MRICRVCRDAVAGCQRGFASVWRALALPGGSGHWGQAAVVTARQKRRDWPGPDVLRANSVPVTPRSWSRSYTRGRSGS